MFLLSNMISMVRKNTLTSVICCIIPYLILIDISMDYVGLNVHCKQYIELQDNQFLLPNSNTIWVYSKISYDQCTIDTVCVDFEFVNSNNTDIQRMARAKLVSSHFPGTYYETEEGLYSQIIAGESTMLCPRNPKVNMSWHIGIEGMMSIKTVYTAPFKGESYTVYEIHDKSLSSNIIGVYRWALGLGLLEYELRTRNDLEQEEYTITKYVLINTAVR